MGSQARLLIARLVRTAAVLCLSLVAGAADSHPELTVQDVRNAADHWTGDVAPGEVVVLTPTNAGPADLVAWGLAGNLSQTLAIGETRVYFDNVPVPIIYTSRGRIGTLVPLAVADKKTTELVVEYQGRRSKPLTLTVVPSLPAIFTLDATGTGPAAMLNETGCCNSVRNPALLGTVVSLYATGEGKLSAGRAAPEVSVTVGGVPAPVVFTANEGSLQVNFRIPLHAPTGDAVPLVLSIRGRSSTAAVTMAIRSPKQSILVLNARPEIRNPLSRILRQAGYAVTFTRELEIIRLRPDLLIVDLTAPPELAERSIAQLRERQPQMKILGLATALEPEALKQASLLGAQSVLTHRVAPERLLSVIGTLLHKKSAVY